MAFLRVKSLNHTRFWYLSLGGLLLAGGGLGQNRLSDGSWAGGGENAQAVNPSLVTGAVITNPAALPPVQTEKQQSEPNPMDVFQPVGPPPADSLPRLFRFGKFLLRPHADYLFTYASGLQDLPGQSESTIIQQISPGFLIDLGEDWTLDYTPTLAFYSNAKFHNTVNHALSLVGRLDYEAWRFAVSHSTQITSDPMVQTGAQTDQTTHDTSLTASRDFNSRLSADFNFSQAVDLVSGYNNSYDWSTFEWLNYKFGPRFNVGLGAGGGYVLVQANGRQNDSGDLDQSYEQLQARANWRATDKISLQLSGGFEDRQFMTANTGDSLNPLFGATIQYQPFRNTQISLGANRSVSSSDSYLAAQQVETTTVSAGLNQRLFRRYHLALTAGYTRMNYDAGSAAVPGSAISRNDDEVSLSARLSHPFSKRGTWAVFYQYSDNASSQPGFSFESNQTGFEIFYNF